MKQLIEELRNFAKERDWEISHSPKNLVMALSVEVAELMEIFMWKTEQESMDYADNATCKEWFELVNEIGDVMIYLTMLAYKFKANPLDAAKKKVEINRSKYPA